MNSTQQALQIRFTARMQEVLISASSTDAWEESSSLRSIVTITALISKGITDSSLKYHLSTARTNGVTRSEMAEILTHIAFYAGWPNAWAAFRMAKEVYADDSAVESHGGR